MSGDLVSRSSEPNSAKAESWFHGAKHCEKTNPNTAYSVRSSDSKRRYFPGEVEVYRLTDSPPSAVPMAPQIPYGLLPEVTW